MALSHEVADMVVCPRCRGDLTLTEDGTGMVCARCRLSYPVRKGIAILRVDEAEPLSQAGSP
ncbi:MAG: Trm112 family protein [bacterium]|nr:Trm112 family protein [bacterium]